jgi:hypothetical protein
LWSESAAGSLGAATAAPPGVFDTQ